MSDCGGDWMLFQEDLWLSLTVHTILRVRKYLGTQFLRSSIIKGFFSYLAPAADMVILTVPHTPRAANIDILLPAAKSFAKNIIVSKDVKKAYSMAKSMTGGDDLVCVTGSFHTVGEVMNICQQE